MARALALALFLFSAGCHHAAAPVDGQKAARAQVDPKQLAELLEASCVPCHDGQPNRPRFDDVKALTPRGALQAALMVSAARMPPPPSRLPDPDQVALIDALCGFGAKDPEACRTTYAPASRQAYVRAPRDIQRILDSKLPYKDDKGNELEAKLLEAFPASDRSRQMNATFNSALSLMASERCGKLTEREAVERCVATVINDELIALPPPVESK